MHTYKLQLHTLLSWHFLPLFCCLSLPSPPPHSLPPCSPSQTVFAQSILAQWEELSSASLDSKIKRNWYVSYKLFIRFYIIIPRYDMFRLISSYMLIYSIFAVLNFVHFVGLMHCKYRHVRYNSACVHSSIQELMSAANVVHKLLTVVHVYTYMCMFPL